VKRDYPQYKRLISAVIAQLGGTDSVQDIASHGINGGFCGFIYYHETHKFAMRNRKAIVEMLENIADDLGEDVASLVNGFGVFGGNMDADDKKDLYCYLGGAKVESGSVTNAMAWFAAEEVARMFCND
jgi:hypothetical protein